MTRGLNIFSTISLLVAGWIGVSAVVMVTTDAAPAALVVLPDAAFLDNLPEDAAVIDATSATITLTRKTPGLTRDLYAAGARLVLPAGLSACLPVSADDAPVVVAKAMNYIRVN